MTQGCYVHIPFCARKCAYCDFNSYGGYGQAGMKHYVDALIHEIHSTRVDDLLGVDTVFFGGGTPTVIPKTSLAAILAAVLETLPVATDAEITTEANPGSTDIEGVALLREAGFNRISFGVQSFDNDILRGLDRIHTGAEANKAIRAARGAGFENISIDLMYGLPRQTLEQWRETLDGALELDLDHLSMYSLIIEEGTGFGALAAKGKLPLPDDDTAADMFEIARTSAAAAGFTQYEISNYAKPGRECRHNIHYWKNEQYLGFGAGAVSYQNNIRRTRILSPTRYADAVDSGADLTFELERPTHEQQMAETMMLGLRLTQTGVDCETFARRFGADPRDLWHSEIQRFAAMGLIEHEGQKLRLTSRAAFLANEVMAAFV